MKKLLTADEITAMLEQQTGQKVWNFAGIWQTDPIEGTPYFMYVVAVRRSKDDVKWIKDALADVLNIEEVKYIGQIRALANA